MSRHNFMHFLEMPKKSSGQRGRHYFLNFLEMRRKMCRKKFRNGTQKKVPESAGLVGGPRSSFGPDLIFKSDQNHQKWPEMGPESTVWAENRSRSMPGPFRSVWEGSSPSPRGPPARKKYARATLRHGCALSWPIEVKSGLEFKARGLGG